MANRRHHFVSQHYLRQFSVGGTEQVVVSLVAPYRHIGAGAIKGQCQEDHFYGKDSALDEMLQDIESTVAPVLVAVTRNRSFNEEQLKALRLLAVQLHFRTRKAAEIGKVFPRFMADQVIRGAIARGDLPAPKGGWTADMMDFGGVPQMMMGMALSSFFETITLRCKLLSAPAGAFFITSDHPVVLLNQYAAEAKTVRTCVGFSQAGFQLVLPLGPQVCAFLYDPGVYKVGDRHVTCVQLNQANVNILNALQVQSAENCLYSHDLATGPEIKRLVAAYGRLRVPDDDGLRFFPGRNANEKYIQFSHPVVKLPRPWDFCRYRRNIGRPVGERRDPLFTEMIMRIEEDMMRNPHRPDLTERINWVVARIPTRD